MKGRISPSMVVACAALFFATTGAGMAASRYLVASVSQIKPSVRHALRGEQGAQGIPGVAGPQGASGVAGPQGAAGTVNLAAERTVVSPAASLSPASPSGGVTVVCPSGYDVLNGGYTGSNEIATASFAKDPNEWAVSAALQPSASKGSVEAWAECVPAS